MKKGLHTVFSSYSSDYAAWSTLTFVFAEGRPLDINIYSILKIFFHMYLAMLNRKQALNGKRLNMFTLSFLNYTSGCRIEIDHFTGEDSFVFSEALIKKLLTIQTTEDLAQFAVDAYGLSKDSDAYKDFYELAEDISTDLEEVHILLSEFDTIIHNGGYYHLEHYC